MFHRNKSLHPLSLVLPALCPYDPSFELNEERRKMPKIDDPKPETKTSKYPGAKGAQAKFGTPTQSVPFQKERKEGTMGWVHKEHLEPVEIEGGGCWRWLDLWKKRDHTICASAKY